MSDARALPLREAAKPGRFGAGDGAAGVTLTIRHPTTLVMVIARTGKSDEVARTLRAASAVMQVGPDQYFVEGFKATELKKRLGASASIIDQSHGRVVIQARGPRVRDVLAKGSPVDLHADHFPINQSAMTQMAHIGVHLTRTGRDEFTLSVFRGFSESFWEWLTKAAAPVGYQVV